MRSKTMAMTQILRPNDERIMVVGATSAIAQVAIQQWATQGARLFLVARDTAKLDAVVKDARVRGGSVKALTVKDFAKDGVAAEIAAAGWAAFDGLDGVLIAHGVLPAQSQIQDDEAAVVDTLRVNGESVCRLLALLGARFAAQRYGWIAAISSVAADRGRAKIYVYGAAKAMVSHYLAGLRQRLAPTGVRVIDIRPGPVDTPMTQGKELMPFMVDAQQVGEGVVKACARANGVVYLPWFWRFIMLVLAHVPERIWLKMKI
jgi:hypothetical protein